MRRGVAAACLALLLWHGLCAGQGPAPGILTAAPPASPAPAAPSPLSAPAAPPAGSVVTDPGGPVGADGYGGGHGGWMPNICCWGSLEYLMWMVRPSPVPLPIATTGVPENAIPGALGQPGTQVVIGQQSFNSNPTSGIRGRLGFEFADTGFGVEAAGFLLDQQVARRGVPSPTSSPSVLALPFFSVSQGSEAVALIRIPDGVEGSINLALRTNLSGTEANFSYALNTYVADWVYIGYRYLNLTEALDVTSRFRVLGTGVVSFLGEPVPPGLLGNIHDAFNTGNEFNGGQFGLVKRLTLGRGRVMLDTRASVALGNTSQTLLIAGESNITAPNGQVLAARPGGLFALPSNSGHFAGDRFSVVPEIGATLYVQAWDNVLAFVGYSFLYWNNVLRPGEQMDRHIELQQVPFSPLFTGTGALQPGVPFHRTDLSVHGLHAGLAFQF
jgi:hypothetical protein